MLIKVLKNDNYSSVEDLPKRKSEKATGYDVITTSDPIIVGEKHNQVEGYKRIDYIEYKTNLFVSTVGTLIDFANGGPHDYDILAFPRSSVSKYNLLLANSIGLIDADYRGEVLLRFKYVIQPEDIRIDYGIITVIPNLDRIYKKGDAICQLKVTKVENVQFVLRDVLDETKRGSGGFGSTDKTLESNQISQVMKLYNESGISNKIPEDGYSETIKEREIL